MRAMESRGMLNSAKRSRSTEGDFGGASIRGADGQHSRKLIGGIEIDTAAGRRIGISVGCAIECDWGDEEGYGSDNGSVERRRQWQMIERMTGIISAG